MGFGSYDESEQEKQEIDTEDIDEGGHSTLPTHDGDVEFEYDDASSEDLLETFQEIQDQ